MRRRRRAPVARWLMLCCGLMVAPAAATHVVSGRVTDAQTGEGLAAATVQIAGTYRGTIANDVGAYALELPQLPARLRVTHIGYHSEEIVVSDSSLTDLQIALSVSPHRLPEIVVYPELGADLMRKVIAHKATWMPRILGYQAQTYTRRTIDRKGEIIQLHEIVSEVYWDRELGTREVVTSVRKTANVEENEMTSALEGTVNLYHDDIEFIESDLMGITHPDALDHYEFTLVGRRLVDDQVVYDLQVEPRSRLHSGFEGTIAVLDSEFVLLEVDLIPTRSTLATAIPVPLIEGLTWRYRQQFRGFDGLWLPVDYRLSVGIKIGMIGLRFPLIGFEQVTRFADYEVDAPALTHEIPVHVSDPIFSDLSSTESIRMDTAAIAADTAFTRFVDPVPMTVAEQVALDTITAEFKGDKVLRPTGFLTRFMDFDEEQSETEEGDGVSVTVGAGSGESKPTRPLRRKWWQVAEYSPTGRFNRVEEALLALGARRQVPWGLHLRGGIGFSSGLEKVNFDIGARRQWGEEDRHSYVDVSYRRGGGSHYSSDTYPVFLNTFQALLGEDDYFDYYWNEGVAVDIGAGPGFGLESWPDNWETSVRLGFRAEDHSSLVMTTDVDLFNRGPLRPNPAVDEGRMYRIELELEVGGAYERFGTQPNRRLEISVEHSADWLGSDFDFTKVHFAADWHQKTFLQRRWVPNALDLRIVGGTFNGDLPVQSFGALDVAMGPLSPYGALRGAHGHPYVGESYLGMVAEHNFRSAPLEMMGLWPLVRRGFGLLVFGGYGQTWIDADRRASLPLVPRWTRIPHKEVGASLFLYNIFRVDVTRLVDPGGWAIGASLARFEFD